MKTPEEIKEAKSTKFVDMGGMTLSQPVCVQCRHWSGYGPACKAFDVIPGLIWSDGDAHDKPVEGDHGIQFEVQPPV